jgi:hypothetical protein
MSLLVLYFSPSDLLTPDASFEAISDRLIVGPVVETLVYSKVKVSVRPSSIADGVSEVNSQDTPSPGQ